MQRSWMFLAMWLAVHGCVCAQSTSAAPQQPADITTEIPANEVSVPFRVADTSGVPIKDLKLRDLRILDNGKKPREIVSFEAYKDLPIRVGFLMDASASALEDLPHDQKIVQEYIGNFLHADLDQAFVTRFDAAARVEQGWTADQDALSEGVRMVRTDSNTSSGTAIFDAVYKTCHDQFDHAGSRMGNFILLFSDGDDNASHTRQLKDDVEECQKANTTIYIISDDSKRFFKFTELQRKRMEIQKTLLQLAELTGGKVFFDQTPEEIHDDLRFIEANMRLQYRVVYKPTELKMDGSFHKIKLDSPRWGGDFLARSGYYTVR